MESEAKVFHFQPNKYRKRYIIKQVSQSKETYEKPWKMASVFIQLPRVMLADRRLSSGALHIASILETFDISSKDKRKRNKGAGDVIPGEERLAHALGKTRPQVSKYIIELKEQGYLKRIARGHKSSKTIFTFPVIESMEEIIQRFRFFAVPLNIDDFKYIAPDLQSELERLFKIVKQIKEEHRKNKIAFTEQESLLLQRFRENVIPEDSPVEDKRPTKPKKRIIAKDEMAFNYIKNFYAEQVLKNMGSIDKNDESKFADAANKCIDFYEKHKGEFSPYMQLNSPHDIAKTLCKSIKWKVEEHTHGDWTRVTPGWFNSEKGFNDLVKYMDYQAMFNEDTAEIRIVGDENEYIDDEEKKHAEEAEYEGEMEYEQYSNNYDGDDW